MKSHFYKKQPFLVAQDKDIECLLLSRSGPGSGSIKDFVEGDGGHVFPLLPCLLYDSSLLGQPLHFQV